MHEERMWCDNATTLNIVYREYYFTNPSSRPFSTINSCALS